MSVLSQKDETQFWGCDNKDAGFMRTMICKQTLWNCFDDDIEHIENGVR